MTKDKLEFPKRIEEALDKIAVKDLIQSIREVLKNEEYTMVYGVLEVSKGSRGMQLCIESGDGTIFQTGDWDLLIGEETDKEIEKKLHYWNEKVFEIAYPLYYGMNYIVTFQFNADNVTISEWEEVGFLDDEWRCNRMEAMLPREPKLSEFGRKKSKRPSYESTPKKKPIYTLTEAELLPYVERVSKRIRKYKSEDTGDMFLYFQWYAGEAKIKHEAGVFYLDSQNRIHHIFDKENTFSLKESSLIDFVEGVNNLISWEIEKYHDLSNDKKYSFEIAVRITDDNCRIEIFNTSLINPVTYANRQRIWLKERFEDLSHLPLHYHMNSLLDNPVVTFKKNMSKNILVKNVPSVMYSRYEGNHIKILTNREVRKYRRYLRKILEEKCEPFMMSNTGNLFFYSYETDFIEVLFVGNGNTTKIARFTKENMAYFVNGYLSEIDRMYFDFNCDLFDVELDERESLYVPYEDVKEKDRYKPHPMSTVFEELLDEL